MSAQSEYNKFTLLGMNGLHFVRKVHLIYAKQIIFGIYTTGDTQLDYR